MACASIFHHISHVGFKYPLNLYKEAHAGNYAMMRSKGDEVVNHMLDSRLERESVWTKKFSTITHAYFVESNIVESQLQETYKDEPYATKKMKEKTAKKAMRNSKIQETLENWNNKI